MKTIGGSLREYVADPLEPGHHHYYVVRARWHAGSLSYGQSKIVDIRAGEVVEVDFLGRVPQDPTFEPIVP